jgi:hypothetical protein
MYLSANVVSRTVVPGLWPSVDEAMTGKTPRFSEKQLYETRDRVAKIFPSNKPQFGKSSRKQFFETAAAERQ